MRADWKFLRLVALLYAASTLGGYVVLSHYASRDVVTNATVAEVMSLVHLLFGYAAIEYSFDKSNITFLKVVLGGMGVRLFLMATLVMILLRYYAFDPLSLTASLFYFYVINLILEIYFLESKVKVKNQL